MLSIKAGGSGLNLTAANHVVLYDRWWNPAVEDQARDRAWRIGQTSTVMCHRLVCPGTVDERVEEIVAGKRRVAGMVLPARSSLGDLDAEQLRAALGLRDEELVEDEPTRTTPARRRRREQAPAGPSSAAPARRRPSSGSGGSGRASRTRATLGSGRPAIPGALRPLARAPAAAMDPAVADRHLTAVYEEAVRAATALAAANGLLAPRKRRPD